MESGLINTLTYIICIIQIHMCFICQISTKLKGKMVLFITTNLFEQFWILVILIGINCAVAQTPDCPSFFKSSERTNKEVNVTESELIKCDVFNNLIDILEQLNLLVPRDSSCYALQKVQQIFGAKDSSSQTVTVSFQFQENLKKIGDKRATVDHVMCNTGNIPYKFQGRQQSASTKNESETDRNDTIALATSTRNGENSVLSHTQVVVIATCSAVIGTFFILAAALRIRNYLKRLRDEHQANRRSNNYRLPLSKGHNSHEGLSRKSSSSSKNSQQNSLLDKDGSRYTESNSPSACRQPLLETTPRLIVTAPSTAASTPGESHSSIQFIDEGTENGEKTGNTNDVNGTTEDAGEKVEQENSPVSKAKDETLDSENTNDESNQIEANEIEMNLTGIIIEPPDDEIAPPLNSNSMLSVSVGLTQSDDSLSSHNASYCYGNQVEYSNGGYGNIGYCPSIENEEPIDEDEIHNEMEENHQQNDNGSRHNSFSRHFCENNPTSFEQDEIKSALCEKVNSERTHDERPGLKDTFNVVSLDQYEQRRKLQRQDRTSTQTNSFDTDAF